MVPGQSASLGLRAAEPRRHVSAKTTSRLRQDVTSPFDARLDGQSTLWPRRRRDPPASVAICSAAEQRVSRTPRRASRYSGGVSARLRKLQCRRCRTTGSPAPRRRRSASLGPPAARTRPDRAAKLVLMPSPSRRRRGSASCAAGSRGVVRPQPSPTLCSRATGRRHAARRVLARTRARATRGTRHARERSCGGARRVRVRRKRLHLQACSRATFGRRVKRTREFRNSRALRNRRRCWSAAPAPNLDPGGIVRK